MPYEEMVAQEWMLCSILCHRRRNFHLSWFHRDQFDYLCFLGRCVMQSVTQERALVYQLLL
jgi:hypothetical protein